MTPVELDVLADKVADRLREPMISAALPADVGELLREMGRHGGWQAMFTLQAGTANSVVIETKIDPNGVLTLMLSTCSGWRFWQGTFQAVGS